MKCWQASIAAILYTALFTTVEVGWHWYISTRLPVAALMRHIYLDTNHSGYLMFFGFPDVLLPVVAISIGIGLIGRRQRVLFAVTYAFFAGAVTVITLPLYTHWLHPVPPPARLAFVSMGVEGRVNDPPPSLILALPHLLPSYRSTTSGPVPVGRYKAKRCWVPPSV